jgi:hypothetical protein
VRYSTRALVLVLALAPGFCASAQPAVTIAPDGTVSVDADRAPLSEVLDQFARVAGAQLTWEGTPQRALVTLKLQARHPAAALAAILEGQPLDYAVALDLSGTRVTTLILGSAPSSAGSRAPSGPGDLAGPRPSSSVPRPAPLRPSEPAAAGDADADGEDSSAGDAAGGDAEAPQEEAAPQEPGPEPGTARPESPKGPASPLGPGPVRFPVSPFAPQPTPMPTPEPTPRT